MLEFKNWLEYMDLDPRLEKQATQSLNMTRSLPAKDDMNPLSFVSGLTRGFHLNTIVGRMLLPWTNALNNPKWAEGLPPAFREAGRPNKNFMAAYDLYKNEIAKVINGLPVKLGKDVKTGVEVDVLEPVKKFMKSYGEETEDYLKHLDVALGITLKVFPG